MQAFKELTPEEAKMAALQFIGQNIGALKELDKNIISKNPTLQGNTLNVHNVLNSIPAPLKPQPQQIRHVAPVTNAPLPQVINDNSANSLNKIISLLETIVKLLEKQ